MMFDAGGGRRRDAPPHLERGARGARADRRLERARRVVLRLVELDVAEVEDARDRLEHGLAVARHERLERVRHLLVVRHLTRAVTHTAAAAARGGGRARGGRS